MVYEARFRTYRKHFSRCTGSQKQIQELRPFIEREYLGSLKRALAKFDDLMPHIRKGNFSIDFGYQVQDDEDPFTNLIKKANTDFNAATVPWLPGAGFLQTARLLAKDTAAIVNVPYAFTKQEMKKSQEELDSVMGEGRLPGFADQPRPPYINSVAPTGVPHTALELVPKDALILTNLWNILHDPETYSDPFLSKEAQWDPRNAALDMGVGSVLECILLNLPFSRCIATSLAVFNIDNAVVNGVPIVPVHESTSVTQSHSNIPLDLVQMSRKIFWAHPWHIPWFLVTYFTSF
ncbi:hypothetical protein BYT27DRAFT_7219720 [Phlegmacium glaucopus]|nr:hypothetical protein BYT27DRAFT_7219720 [Phlegmacium glaucopus]